MRVKFTKMHGAGNDFIVFDAVHQTVDLTPEKVRRLADRRFGVGCDQVLVVEPPTRPDTDFSYRIFNADGSEAGQCGNGARCFVRFVHDKGLTENPAIRIETAAGVITPILENDGSVTVDMGPPRFDPQAIPFAAPARSLTYSLDIPGRTVEISALSMGNPHAVQVVADVDAAPVSTDGPQIERHARFPDRVNAGFMQVVDEHAIRLRVWERGAGETLSCGTGACAAAVAGISRGLLESPVDVETRGGRLAIAWAGDDASVFLTGPAEKVFEGETEL